MPRNILERLTVLLLLFLVLACVPKNEKTLQVGSNPWIGYEPLYVAQDLGFYQEANVKIAELSSASQVAKAFEQGIIDVAALTLDEAIRLTFRDDNYEILWVMDYSNGGDAIIARQSYSSIEALKGQKVGLEEGAVSKYLLTRAAQLHQMSIDDFEIVPVHLNQQQREFTQGNLDALVTFDPIKTHLLELGANQLFSSQMIPGEIVDVLVVKKSTYAEHEAQYRAILTGYLSAVQLIEARDQRAVELLVKRTGVTQAEMLSMLENIHIPDIEEVRTMLYSDKPSLKAQIQQLSEYLTEQGEITSPVASNSLMPSFDIPL
ncbi:ABC transporter substrate-binding protein [Planctobacterium marinum]|uniref:SsuA/THI5-like domain-containing protein n=1 Tax=Planctobacterium marinum TaxID=1631968 RepID=A0AA48HDE0_9ALTE|nr:hypothetical protein MACH26_04640 [Planctobacterium marinum]